MREDKLYKILLHMYREVYAHIGVDFDSLDKDEGFYNNYEIDEAEEKLIIDRIINSSRITVLQKRCLYINYYMGCSPKIKL